LSQPKKLAIAALLGAGGLLLAARLHYPGRAPVALGRSGCDPSLWDHVYDKDRLKIIEPCTAVEGRVMSMHRNGDGDLHIGLDPQDPSVLNLVNVTHAKRLLIVEVICDHPPTDASARSACGDLHPQVIAPRAGERIRVTGAYVTDRDNGWNEVHPVTRIEILR